MQREQLVRRLAQRIRQLREKHNISQENLAHEAGLSRVSMAQVEQGRRAASLLTLHKIAKGFGISMSELLKGVD